MAAATTPKLKLWYFPLPGRAEVTRLLLKLGKVPHEDFRFPRESWPEIKPKMPFGQVPVLEIDGTLLAQTTAIERYAAKLAGLYPESTGDGSRLAAAQVDSMVDAVKELPETLTHTFYIKDADEKLAARKAVVEGALGAKLARFNDLLGQRGPDGWLVGDSMTWADVALFVALSSLVSGFFDGIPADLYASYPHLTAFHKRIANHPVIKEYYADPINADALRNSYRV